jgi:uncharacterized protein (TIGR03435 family)
MLRKRLLGLAGALLAAAAAFSQTPVGPSFEVATIKPAAPINPTKVASGQLHVGMKTDAGRVDIGFFSLSDLIRTAYRIKPYQLKGPDWLAAERWDIAATIPAGASVDQVPEMLQSLLADRFKLTIHRTSTEQPIYALVVTKGGPKLKDAEPDAPAASAPEGQPAGNADNGVRISANTGGRGATIFGKNGQTKVSIGQGGAIRMEFSKMRMADLADMLSPFADRPVLDMTELKGAYQVGLDLAMEDMMKLARASGIGAGMMGPGAAGGGAADAARAPAEAASTPSSSVFTAVQQLGLKLEARKAPMETIVVDHVERTPTDN